MTAPTPGFSRFRARPYTPVIGALIDRIDLSAPLDDTIRAELRAALAQFSVLFLREQPLDAIAQVALANVFGRADGGKAYFPTAAEHPVIEVIETRAGGPRYTTDQWHHDLSYLAAPPAGAVLCAVELPPAGGDTLWASGRAVYRALDPGLAARLEGLRASHSIEHSGWPDILRQQPDGEARYRAIRAEHPPVSHPIVRVEPLTGDKYVFVNPKYVERIHGVSRQESDTLLAQLQQQFERPEHQARLRWAPGTVAIWDNLTTSHYAVADYLPAYRRMHRVTF